LMLSMQLDQPFFETNPSSIDGLLQYGDSYWEVSIPVNEQLPAGFSGQVEVESVDVAGKGFEQKLLNMGLLGWLVLAFLGGLILNVMPCVLPVLSLKVFSLLKHSGQPRSHALAHGFAYTVGVVVCFLALAGLLFALRAGGELVGWGFQLQSPGFMLTLGVLFFVFGLNLLGVFEIGMGLVGADAKVSQRNDVLGSFGMGVFAAVVGAPCIGPLLAGVSGVAIQATVLQGLLVFGMMGFGLASPFLLFAIFPKLIAFMPKPGAWMETVKQVMGFTLMLAVLAVAWIIGNSGGTTGMLILLSVLLAAAIGAWVYGRWGAPVKPKSTQRIALALALLAIVGGTAVGAQKLKAAYMSAHSEVKEDGAWATWSPERVEFELAAGNPVFVDFTASWCAICQVNKVPLRSEEITELFEARGVVTLEADWTLRDPVIATVLQEYDRAGVPLYLLYDADGEVTVLPQQLTKGNIRSAVEKHLK
ncbi:MAG: protein-disulfide reductase DsbD family protein, partial [Coraliomargarita sp.]